MIVFQTSNPKIADVVQASGEVFEYTPAPQPKPQQLVVPVGRTINQPEETQCSMI